MRKTSLLGAWLTAALVCACSDDARSSSGSDGVSGARTTSSAQASGATSSSGSGAGNGSGGDRPSEPAGSGGAARSTGSVGSTSPASTSAGGAPSAPLEGYWVWTKQIENGVVTLEITDADMEPRVGPSGWPGCPEGILCTRYGIHKVALGDSGRLHQQHNVTTSSDFQTLGTWSDASDGIGAFVREEQYSCAHPDAVNADVVAGGFRYQLAGDELFISVSGFSGFPFVDPGADPTTWLVYKPITRDDYYGKYMIRVCQPFDDFCHEACFDDTLVDET